MFLPKVVPLEPFLFHAIDTGGRTTILLPKLNRAQVEIIRERLESLGFKTAGYFAIRAERKGTVVHVRPSGLCWSSSDPTDVIAPVVPRLLSAKKENVTPEELEGYYFTPKESSGLVRLNLKPRIESSALWDQLRARGLCGLTPDEHTVYKSLLESGGGECRLLTDFPVEGSVMRRKGRKVYFDSSLEPEEAASTLRVVGLTQERNSYLPRDSLLEFGALGLSQDKKKERQRRVFADLGEWCYFTSE